VLFCDVDEWITSEADAASRWNLADQWIRDQCKDTVYAARLQWADCQMERARESECLAKSVSSFERLCRMFLSLCGDVSRAV